MLTTNHPKPGGALTESIDDDIVIDIATLARKLAEKEPFKSASGPEALRAFATHLDEMTKRASPDQMPVVNVAVQSRRRKN
jgi:hypothetical protein